MFFVFCYLLCVFVFISLHFKPLLAGNWKRPFPGLGLSVGIFTAYLVADSAFHYAMKPPPALHPKKSSFVFKEAGDFGDTMPEGHKKGHH